LSWINNYVIVNPLRIVEFKPFHRRLPWPPY
jgi:hypothetical protein